MVGESDRSWLFCNYCGEPLVPGRSAYDHVVEYHGAEIHVGPGEYDARLKRRVLVFQVVGYVLIMASVALYLFVLNPEPTGIQGLVLVLLMCGGIIGVFASGELYSRKGQKRGEEVVMDLHTVCDICGQRMAWRDIFSHTEVHHPDQYAVERRLYGPMAVVMLSIIGLGFLGMVVAMFLIDEDIVPQSTVFILFAASILTVFVGCVIGYAFDRLYHRPRMEKLAKEWSERHHHSKKE